MKKNNHVMTRTGVLALLLLFISLMGFAQSRTITGKVTDASGPLVNVSIQVKGTTTGAYTNAEGNFSLKVPSNAAVLVIRYVGMETQEVPVGEQSVVNVTMKSTAGDLNEVVVVGYGTQKRSDLTGAVGSVKAAELQQRPAVSLEQALAGRIAGVNVSTNSGRPGGRTRVQIRGFSSINAGVDPLYVVDGIIWIGGIGSINPNDIESIDVLKDASATAIYGTRGTNGVIMVTTKRGRKGSSGVSYDGFMSVSKMARKQKVLNSREWLMVEEQAYKNAAKFDPDGFAQGKYKDPIEKRKQYIGKLFDANLNPLYDVDWQDEATRTAISQAHNLSYTGSDEKTNYGLFLGYQNDNGIIKNSYLKRYNVRAVLDRQMTDWLKVGGTIAYSNIEERRSDESTGANNVPRQMIEMVPFIPYKYPDGTFGYRKDYEGLEGGDNPLTQLQEVKRLYKTSLFNGNTYVNMKLIKGLEFTSTFGVNIRNQSNPYFKSTFSDLDGGLGNNYAEIYNEDQKFWQWSNNLNYNTEFGKDHKLNVLLGTELQHSELQTYKANARNFPDNYFEWNKLQLGAIAPGSESSWIGEKMASFFGRVFYTFKDKYLLTITGRADGSSKFGSDNKFAFFPSAAFAWRASEEEFLKNSKVISNLKVRTSAGVTGNSGITAYTSRSNMKATDLYVFNGTRTPTFQIDNLGNSGLKWEKTAQYDLGVDIGFLENRISLSADAYIKKTTDLLLAAPVPATSGYTTMLRNIGSLQNVGVDLSLNTVNIQRKDFTWNTTLNFSWFKNKITALGSNNEDIFMLPDFLGRTNILRVGQSVASFYGYVREGTWSEAEAAQAARYGRKPGDLKFKDLNNDGQINNDDRQIIGKGIPDFYGTFLNSFRYKQFDLVLELQYSYGNDVFKLTEHSSEDRVGIANSYKTVLDAWTPQNQNTPIAQWRATGAGYDSRLDTRKVEDGSFIRGKNVALGYTLKPEVAKRLKLSNLRVYVSAQNFFLLTKYTGYDPETSTWDDTFAQGIQFHDYPKARTFTLGLNVNF
ncbi:TonB-dependent receptor [Chitinophaga pendula]|uniref:SusC/RagA family TonB-linked outer membrane protein n=1 Tax=Chitinophaga TaxID=79328 RepID=UPI000BAFDC37|nr:MULTISPECIES: TonB-dependent receptor [Chitinophaga]ASZ13388.1 SusC/RagA family TonB-linked outer membrane protein [Chitinophaga sp. MD30]UCJ08988.1 TonB-dependent receptor [Chitinophaga pendula]